MEAVGLRGSAVGVAAITAGGPVFEERDSGGHIRPHSFVHLENKEKLGGKTAALKRSIAA